MHFLKRNGVASPPCLEELALAGTGWKSLGSDCKRQIREQLKQLQGNASLVGNFPRCAYCEGDIHADGHIEHFFPRKHYPDKTFVWTNLFLACGSHKHCGHYKEDKTPEPALKPDVDDPDEYLYFHSSGQVRERSGLNGTEQETAAATMQLFNLNEPELMARRRRAVKFYYERVIGDLLELDGWSDEDRKAYLEDEINATCHQAYATAIKHFLQVRDR